MSDSSGHEPGCLPAEDVDILDRLAAESGRRLLLVRPAGDVVQAINRVPAAATVDEAVRAGLSSPDVLVVGYRFTSPFAAGHFPAERVWRVFRDAGVPIAAVTVHSSAYRSITVHHWDNYLDATTVISNGCVEATPGTQASRQSGPVVALAEYEQFISEDERATADRIREREKAERRRALEAEKAERAVRRAVAAMERRRQAEGTVAFTVEHAEGTDRYLLRGVKAATVVRRGPFPWERRYRTLQAAVSDCFGYIDDVDSSGERTCVTAGSLDRDRLFALLRGTGRAVSFVMDGVRWETFRGRLVPAAFVDDCPVEEVERALDVADVRWSGSEAFEMGPNSTVRSEHIAVTGDLWWFIETDDESYAVTLVGRFSDPAAGLQEAGRHRSLATPNDEFPAVSEDVPAEAVSDRKRGPYAPSP